VSITHQNIIANYIGRAWSFISVFIFVPFYLKLLGSEAFGIVSFFAVVLGFLAIADAGLTATLNREFARADRTLSYKANMLKTIEIIYIGICLTVVLGMWFFAPLIATNWLHAGNIPTQDVVFYVRLIGVGVAFQLVTALYQGGLMGLQKQVLANGLLVGHGVLRSGLVLLPLYFFPSLSTFFFWQIGVTIIYLVVLRVFVKREVRTEEKAVFSKAVLVDVKGFAAGMFLISVLSATLMQTDRLVVSGLFSLSEFGFYSLAGMFSQIPFMLVLPIGLAILPQLTQRISAGDFPNAMILFRKTTFIVVAIASFVAFFLIAYTPEILMLWTQNTDLVSTVSRVAQILCLGVLFQATQLMPYYLGIANGHTKTNIILGFCSVVFLVPALFISIAHFGLFGAGIPWLIMSVITFIALGYIILRKFANKMFKTWFFSDTLVPLVIALLAVGTVYLATLHMPKGWLVLVYGLIAAILWALLSLWILNRRFPEDQMLVKIKRIVFRNKQDCYGG